jgi:RNA polymerase sigma-70 factor (ECF subfamily)
MAGCATVPQAVSDDVLVESAKKGDADAFAMLMDRYSGFCLSKAYSILQNRGDAEDEVQNAWLQAWTHLASYQVRGAFSAWLSRILLNQCLMRLRKRKLTPMMSIDQVFDIEGAFRLDLIDQRDLPEDIVGNNEVSRVLSKEIRGVPPVLREVLVLRDVGEVAMRDIAGDLGLSIPAAKSRLMRSRIELRRRLAKHYGKKGGGTLTQKSARPQVAYSRGA